MHQYNMVSHLLGAVQVIQMNAKKQAWNEYYLTS